MASSQSTTTRLLIIASIYAVVLIAYPFARHLTSVKRLPIDAAAIEQWRRQLVDTGCAAIVPTTLRIGGDWRQADEFWKQNVAAHIEHLLQRSSEAGSSSRSVDSSWCVQWQIDFTGSQQHQNGFNAFEYTTSSSNAPQKDRSLLSIPPNLPSYSAKSVALSLARRLAIDLDLPFKDRLVDTEPAATGTTEEEREPQVEQHVAEIPTGMPVDDIVTSAQQARPLLPELVDDEESNLLRQLQAHSGRQTSDGQDLSIALPSHVMLHFHVLNEELSLQEALPPLPASLSGQLRAELEQTRSELSGIAELGMSSSWAIGKETVGVQWDSIEWLGERRWEEEEEVEEEREVEYQEEVPIEEEQEVDDDEDDEDSQPSPRTQMITRTRIERFTTTRMVPRNESIPKRVSHFSADQLEIFVDENGWDLTDHGSAGDQLAGFPYLYPTEQQPQARSAVEVKNLHFLLYNPAKDHRPLVYVGEAEDEEERRTMAVEQEAEGAAWGWIIPSWGGAIIYNGLKESEGDEQLPTEQELQQEILPVFHEQIRTLLALPPLSDEGKDHRLGIYHLKRRLVLSRAREAVETLTATLNSLTKLTNLEVGREVQASVSTSLAALSRLATFASGRPSTLEEMFPVSLLASTSASAAFHDPRMVGMLYFPAEHTYAVYTPLFGPLAVPMILAGLKIGKSWLQKRKRSSAKRTAAKED